MSDKKGVCSTCRHHKHDKHGVYCAVGVVDRTRERNQPPCGWWKKRKVVEK